MSQQRAQTYSFLRVKRKTHDQLVDRGTYRDSMDSIIKKLLNEVKK